MKNNKLLLIALLFPIIFFCSWIGYLEYAVRHAPKVEIAATGYDPRDLLSGHYINLQLEWDNTNCKQFKDNTCPREQFDTVYRFYLPEDEAKKLDLIMRQSKGPKLDIKLVFAYRTDAKPILEDMLINTQNWKEWLQQQN